MMEAAHEGTIKLRHKFNPGKNPSLPKIKRLVWLVSFTLAVLLIAQGQNLQDRIPQRGAASNGSFALGDIEAINLENGNLLYKMPLASLPVGRGGALSPTVYLTYNSKLYDTRVGRLNAPCNDDIALRTVPDYSFLTFNPEYSVACLFFWREASSFCIFGRDMIGGGGYTTPSCGQVPMCSYPGTQIMRGRNGGWNYGVSYRLQTTRRPDTRTIQACNPPPPTSDYNAWKTEVVFPDGSTHEVIPSNYSRVDGTDYFYGYPGMQAAPMEYYSIDGTYFRMTYNPNGTLNNKDDDIWTLHFADGTKVQTDNASRIQTTTDRNGNSFTTRNLTLANGSPAIQVADQLGREIVIEAPENAPHLVRVKSVGGTELTTIINWGQTSARGKKYISWNGEVERVRTLSVTLDVIRSITLPNGLQYRFEYNSDMDDPQDATKSVGWGELSKVILPTEAFVEYAYSMDGIHGGDLGTTQTVETDEILASYPTHKRLTYQEMYDGQAPQTRVETWTYAKAPDVPNQPAGYTAITAPDGSQTQEFLYNDGGTSERTGLSYMTIAADGTVIERDWRQNRPPSITTGQANPYVKTEYVSIANANGARVKTAIKDYSYDKNGNVTRVAEYDFVEASVIDTIRDASGRPSGIPANLQPVRVTETSYYHPTPDASDSSTNSPNAYWNASAPDIKGLVKAAETKSGGGTIVSRSEFFYGNTTLNGSPAANGNLTETRSWDSSRGPLPNQENQQTGGKLDAANSISTSAVYNSYGMPAETTDARGVKTTFTYGCINGQASCQPTEENLYPTKTEAASNFSALKRTSTAEYDFYTGLVKKTTDVDNQISTETEYDIYGRAIKVKTAPGTPLEIWTRTEYEDQLRRVVTRADLFAKGDGRKVAIQHFDQLGRVRLSREIENLDAEDPYNEQHGIKVQTRYKTENGFTYQLVSNPYRAAYSDQATNEPTMGWTRTKTVNTGRRSEVESFSGAALPAPFTTTNPNTTSTGAAVTESDANITTATDASGRKSRSITNAFGQLIRVDEATGIGGTADADLGTVTNPTQPTFYSYDTLGRMVKVTQGNPNQTGQTVQYRYFLYDSLGRLLRVRQPEQDINAALTTTETVDGNNQWTAGFAYDVAGNVLRATDAKGVNIINEYDQINRVLKRCYTKPNITTTKTVCSQLTSEEIDSDTPTVTYTYDTLQFGKGKLAEVSSTVSTSKTAQLDSLGRPLVYQQITDGRIYQSSYQYNLSGALVKETYPSGREVKHEFETDGDLLRVFGKPNPTATERTYASGFSYTPDGKIQRLKLGNGKWESAKFNTRLQVTELALGNSDGDGSLWKLNYEYGELNADGTVNTAKNTGNIGRTRTSNQARRKSRAMSASPKTLPPRFCFSPPTKPDLSTARRSSLTAGA